MFNPTCRRNSTLHRALPIAVRQLSAWPEGCAGCGKVRNRSQVFGSAPRGKNPSDAPSRIRFAVSDSNRALQKIGHFPKPTPHFRDSREYPCSSEPSAANVARFVGRFVGSHSPQLLSDAGSVRPPVTKVERADFFSFSIPAFLGYAV
jgi:hypothetical protein